MKNIKFLLQMISSSTIAVLPATQVLACGENNQPKDLSAISFPAIKIPVWNNKNFNNDDVGTSEKTIRNTIENIINQSYKGMYDYDDYRIDLNNIEEGIDLSKGLDVRVYGISDKLKNGNIMPVTFTNPINLENIKFKEANIPVINNSDLSQNDVDTTHNAILDLVEKKLIFSIYPVQSIVDYIINWGEIKTDANIQNGIDIIVKGNSKLIFGETKIHINFTDPLDLSTIKFNSLNLPVINNKKLTEHEVYAAKARINYAVQNKLDQLALGIVYKLDYEIDFSKIKTDANVSQGLNIIISSLSTKLIKKTYIQVTFSNPIIK